MSPIPVFLHPTKVSKLRAASDKRGSIVSRPSMILSAEPIRDDSSLFGMIDGLQSAKLRPTSSAELQLVSGLFSLFVVRLA